MIRYLLIILFLINNAHAFYSFQPKESIKKEEIDFNINYIKKIAQDKLNIPFDSLTESSVVRAEYFNSFFNQFKIYDNNQNFIELASNGMIYSAILNHNFNEAKRIVENKIHFQSCLEILNDGYSQGNQTYTIDIDGVGPKEPINIYCDMTTAGGGWTVIVNNENTDLEYLSKFGDTSQIASTFYSNPNYGIGWSQADDTYRSLVMNINYDEIYVTYTGFYNTPSGSMGNISLRDLNDSSLLLLNDAWNLPISGQSLAIEGTYIFIQEQLDVVNRTDIIERNSSLLDVRIRGRLGYPFGKKYLKKLMFR